MMEPTRGSKVHVAELFAEVSTPRQLVEPSLQNAIAQILKSTKVPPDALWLET